MKAPADVAKGLIAVAAYVAALVTFGAVANYRAARPEVDVSIDEVPAVSIGVSRMPPAVVVSFRLQRPNWDATLSEVVMPAELPSLLGLQLPEGWVQDPGPPLRWFGDETPLPAGYVRFVGRLPLSAAAPAAFTIRVAHPAAAAGTAVLRYEGHDDMCPIAGAIEVELGTGRPLPPRLSPFPPSPLEQLMALC